LYSGLFQEPVHETLPDRVEVRGPPGFLIDVAVPLICAE
jgi:hypothetical protein